MTTLAQRIVDLATRIATEAKSHKTLINGNAADLSALSTTAKTNLVAALNELKANIVAFGTPAQIDDATTVLDKTWSSTKISGQITAAINALTNGAPAALDTLKELADAIADDAGFAATVTTSLGNRVRVDAVQAFTAPQKAQGNANLGSAALVDTGTLDTDFVSTFNAGLA